MEALREELFHQEPNPGLLHQLLGYGEYVEVRNLGNVLIGRKEGDARFRHIIGKPSKTSFKQASDVVNRLSPENRAKALQRLKEIGIGVNYSFAVID